MTKRYASRESGLKAKLIKSHLSVALTGVLLLIVCLVVFMQLKKNMTAFMQVNIPITRATINMQTDLQASLAALRGWMAVPDDSFLKERNQAWYQGIMPNLKELEKLIQKNKNPKMQQMVIQLKQQLVTLRSWQWHIEDVAQAPGNYPDRVFLRRRLEPIAQQIIEFSNALISKEGKLTSQKDNRVVYYLADFRGYFARSMNLLINYILTNNEARLVKSEKLLALAASKLDALPKLQSGVLNQEQKMFNQLLLQVDGYTKLSNQLIQIKQSKTSNLANYWLVNKAVPISRAADDLLNKMIGIEVSTQNKISDRIGQWIKSIFYSLIVFIILLILLSLLLASYNAKKILRPIYSLLEATRKMANGMLKEDIEVTSKDEIGKLTESFNQMFHQRQIAEEKTKKIVETAVDPIVTINENGIIQFCNSATSKLLGYSTDELTNSNIANMMPEPYCSKHSQYLQNYLKTKIKKVIGQAREVEVLSKTGELIPINLSISEIILGNNRLFTGIMRDIRKEKMQTEKMQKINSELEYENKEKTIVADLDGQLRGIGCANDFAEITLKFFAENFNVLISVFYLVDEENKSITISYSCGMKESIKGKRKLKWGDGLIGRCVESKKMLIINNLPEGYFKISSSSGEALPSQVVLLPFVYSRSVVAVVELCGLREFSSQERNQIEALSYSIVTNLNITLAKERLQLLLEKTEEQRQLLQYNEEELRAANEDLELKAISLKESEEELRAANEELQAQIDLIENQKNEIDQKAKKIEKINQYKTEFLANMSHELRTPLNSLLILAKGFVDNKQENLTQEQKEEAKIIYDSGHDLLSLINDILDISKVEAGKLNIEIHEVGLSDVTMALLNLFSPISQQKGLEFKIDASEAQNISTFECDEMRLLQILRNLLSNAFKFTEKGSVTLQVKIANDSIQFCVIDTGIGVAKDKQKAIFSKFQQADGSTSRKYGGTGLGLAISKKLAELMQGNLTLTSKENEGSTFTLTLPINRKDVIHEKEESNSKNNFEKISEEASDKQYKLLVVGDGNVLTQKDLSKVLSNLFAPVEADFIKSIDDIKLQSIIKNYFCVIFILSSNLESEIDSIKKFLDETEFSLPIILYTDDNLEESVQNNIRKYTNNIIIKGPKSFERLFNEISLIFRDMKKFKEEKIEPLADTAMDEPTFSGQVVLLADDDLRNTFALSRFLERQGLKVIIVDNGQLAIEKLKSENAVDIILMDIMMPVMDGYEAIKKIRDMKTYSNIPIIAVTAKATKQDEQQCLDLGANAYMTKPIDTDDLIKLIAKHLASGNFYEE